MKGAQAEILARLGSSTELLRLGICDGTNYGVVVAIAVLVDNIPAEKTAGLSLKAGWKYLLTKPSLWMQLSCSGCPDLIAAADGTKTEVAAHGVSLWLPVDGDSRHD